MSDSSAQMPEMMTPSSAAASKLRDDIRTGRYTIGKRLDNERDLADRFGVNRGTIRKALKILEKERLIARRQGHGTFVTNPASASTTGAAVSLIGAMVWEKEYYFGTILNGAFSRSAARGRMLTTASNATEEVESYNVDAFIRSGIQGLVLTPKSYSIDSYRRLVEANIPVVLLDAVLPGVEEDFVAANDRQGTEMATRHLIELGHTRIAYVGNDVGTNDRNDLLCRTERLDGFTSTCMRHNLEVPKAWIEPYHPDDPAIHFGKLRELIGQENRPTAIVTFGDGWAIRVIQVARELGLKVPEDLSVTGFDDSEKSRTNDIPLTTINPEPDELGTRIVDLLVERIEDPQPRPKRSILITPRLVVRESTAKPTVR